MTTDFRALCADLLWALENAIRVIYHEDGTKHISTAKPIVNRARAALADGPAAPAPPAAGEVAELVAWLREIAQLWEPDAPRAKQLFRAADLLERLAPQPPSLAEQALGALEQIDGWAVSNMNHLSIHDDLVTGVEAIRTALERLQELEGTNG